MLILLLSHRNKLQYCVDPLWASCKILRTDNITPYTLFTDNSPLNKAYFYFRFEKPHMHSISIPVSRYFLFLTVCNHVMSVNFQLNVQLTLLALHADLRVQPQHTEKEMTGLWTTKKCACMRIVFVNVYFLLFSLSFPSLSSPSFSPSLRLSLCVCFCGSQQTCQPVNAF